MNFRFHRSRPLRSTLQPPPVPGNNNEEPHQTEHERSSTVLPEPVPDQCQTPPARGIQENDSLSPVRGVPGRTEPDSAFLPRRPGRTRHSPIWLEDYDLSWTLKHWVGLASILCLLPLCCSWWYCKGKGRGVTCVTIVIRSASHVNLKERATRPKHKKLKYNRHNLTDIATKKKKNKRKRLKD